MKTKWLFATGMGLLAAGMFFVNAALVQEFVKRGKI